MPLKTQKIKEEIHKALKKLAAEEGKSLQEVTEEILENGLQRRRIEADKDPGGSGGNGGSRKNR